MRNRARNSVRMSVRARWCCCTIHVALALFPALTLVLTSCTPKESGEHQKLRWPENFHVQLDDEPETLLTMQHYNIRQNFGHNMLLEVWSDESGEMLLQSRLRAKRAYWDSVAQLWRLQDVYLVENYDADEEISKSFSQLDTVLGFSVDDLKKKVAEHRRTR